jgi:hypothetical protein
MWLEFELWREGVKYALDGGLWLHRFTLKGEQWAHLISANRLALLEAGQKLNLPARWLQFRPLKHPQTGQRVDAWHWDLRAQRLDAAIGLAGPRVLYKEKGVQT